MAVASLLHNIPSSTPMTSGNQRPGSGLSPHAGLLLCNYSSAVALPRLPGPRLSSRALWGLPLASTAHGPLKQPFKQVRSFLAA